ncbi:hypothetical protein [Algibacter pectinivorans]|uniref:Uncharacterized protein n=1 Tax=Algibacter pectinivorans TaxID=870482 RepID=A0A1I1NIB8_9FLAO|nr:hypothetical protein [Algibacter pectinivorans]SFC97454.1 hypothetical protein SAMN04487987_102335 [Algibacter pectinivorans]
MKKKVESELVSIAHRILKLKGKEDVLKMHAEVSALYEKLSVMKFAHENFEGDLPTIGNDSSFFGMLDTAFNNKVSDNIEVEDKIYVNLDAVEEDDIMEPVMNKIKDMVAFMPEETEEAEQANAAAEEDIFVPKTPEKQQNIEDITAGFGDIPVFEPVSNSQNGVPPNGKKSLNDKLKVGGLNIGLNDKIAFIKHLFDGKSEDYDRVLSQLNTFITYENAKNFIVQMVKPDYNNWEGKEEFEARFMHIIEAKFN